MDHTFSMRIPEAAHHPTHIGNFYQANLRTSGWKITQLPSSS
jgi:hypothetical protein